MERSPRTVILVADDEEAVATLLRDTLESFHYGVVVAHDGEEAMRQIRSNPPDLILLDVMMPRLNGYEVCTQVKSDVFLRHIPVMLLTAKVGTSSKVTGLERGADDYLTKPFEIDELMARIKTLLRRTRLGLEANPLSRLPGNVTIENEIVKRIEAKAPFAVLYIDVNDFKAYNDIYGFVKGDDVIRETSKIILKQSMAAEGFVGHIGGDDFIVVVAPEKAETLAKGILQAFDKKAPGFYNEEDQKRGYIETKDRRGELTRFPLLSVAIGIATTNVRPLTSLGEVSKIGTELKHFAKERKEQGSAYAIDRRRYDPFDSHLKLAQGHRERSRTMKYKILVVEDSKADAETLTNACQQGGFQISLADSGEKALEMVWTWKPDMLLLDLSLPGINGKEVCRILREDDRGKAIPLIMVSAAKERGDILAGFAAGTDDYLTKPIEPQELVARMNAVLRRYHKKNGEGEILKVGRVMLDLSKHRVEVSGDMVKLTGKEFGLLEVMMKKSGRVLSRQFLLEYVWGYEEEVLTRTIDMHIARLRQKLGDEGRERIQTVERFGYRFSDE